MFHSVAISGESGGTIELVYGGIKSAVRLP